MSATLIKNALVVTLDDAGTISVSYTHLLCVTAISFSSAL